MAGSMRREIVGSQGLVLLQKTRYIHACVRLCLTVVVQMSTAYRFTLE